MQRTVVCGESPTVSLRKVWSDPDGIPPYYYLHDDSCSGRKVALLPFRYLGWARRPVWRSLLSPVRTPNAEYLLCRESVPCWGLKPRVCVPTVAVTGPSAVQTAALFLLRSITGVFVSDDALLPLGRCFDSRYTDSEYSLFAVDLTGRDEYGEPSIASGRSSSVTWCRDLDDVPDPIAHAVKNRLISAWF